jgi:hypothetical protein
VIVDHRLVYDAVFPTAAGIAAVPMDSVDKVEWPGSRPPFPKVPGDGLLVVRKAGHPDGAILLFFPQNNVYSGVPQDYQHLDIQLRDTTL